jgi:hypothetical protein
VAQNSYLGNIIILNLELKYNFMSIYNELSQGKKYLINEFEGDQVLLVESLMKTEFCVLILVHEDVESIQWKRLNDEIFEIIEELSDQKFLEFEDLFEEEDEN